MQRIQALIEQKARDFEQTPILVFMRDSSIDPRQRFSFAPCMAPWVLGFADLNKFVLRDDASQEPLQQMINTHAREDDQHWQLYLKDLWTLGMNDVMDFSSALRLLWGEESRKSRQIVYSLAGLIASASPEMRMVILKVIEEASSVSFKVFIQAAREFQQLTGERLYYFGEVHLELESGHAMREAEAQEKLATIHLTPEQYEEARNLVERVFLLLREMTDEFLTYAKRHPRTMPIPRAEEAVEEGRQDK